MGIPAPIHGPDGLQFYRSPLLDLPHGMFCRHGGVSPQPHASLNLSYGVGDHAKNVAANRQRIKECLGVRCLVSAVQVHGSRVAVIDTCGEDREIPDHDALITNQPGVGLLIQQADCQAILLHDPVRGVIGAAHSGWRGSVADIGGKTVAAMQEFYASEPGDIRAVISPSLGPCCAEFINYLSELPSWMHDLQVRPDYFDFRAASRMQLMAAGLQEQNIDCMEVCTRCSREFFSYRRAVQLGSPVTGRNGSVIALPA
jgi:YfiH family protein